MASFQSCNHHDCTNLIVFIINIIVTEHIRPSCQESWWIYLLSRSGFLKLVSKAWLHCFYLLNRSGFLSSSLSRILRPRLKHKIMIFFKSYTSCMFSDHSNLPMRINCVDFSYKPLHENMSISTCTPHTLGNLFWNFNFQTILSPISN